MDQNKIFVIIVLDRSGSMAEENRAPEAIGGFNRILEDQKKTPGVTLVTLAQFDDQYELLYDGVPVEQVPPLTSKTFVPRGFTALRDAMGKTIVSVGEKLAAMPESERPAKVIMVTITDGNENASKEYTHERLKRMIEYQTKTYSWEFIFLGSEPKAVEDAVAFLGILPGSAFCYDSHRGGTLDAYNQVSRGLTSVKCSVTSGKQDTSYKHGGDSSDEN
jgi:hypothetical protein